jgi:mTERF domain-containing protein
MGLNQDKEKWMPTNSPFAEGVEQIQKYIIVTERLKKEKVHKAQLCTWISIRTSGFGPLNFEETMDSQEPRSQVLLKAPISSSITPKLDLFLSLGMSRSHLARTLSSDPNFFTGILQNQIIT